MTKWAVATAKARFSAVLDQAESEGPQVVERRRRRFVLLTLEDLESRTFAAAGIQKSGSTPGKRLWDVLRCLPVDGTEIELERPRWRARKVQL